MLFLRSLLHSHILVYESRHEKIYLRGFQQGSTKAKLHSHGTWLTALNKKIDRENKGADQLRRALELTCAFFFACTKYGFSFDAAHVSKQTKGTLTKTLFCDTLALGQM